MSLVVKPSARERFTPRELVAAYEDFLGSEPQYLDAETGIKASAYLFGAGVLLVYEEPETNVVMLIHPSAWKGYSANFARKVPKDTLFGVCALLHPRLQTKGARDFLRATKAVAPLAPSAPKVPNCGTGFSASTL